MKRVDEHLPPIRLIDFNLFADRTSFPRFPENRDLCTTLDVIDRDNALVIFISHCWMRGWSEAEGWDGKPHPDNVSNDKFNLTVAAVTRIKHNMAPGMRKVYLWMDFACMDQDGDPAGELKQLDEIVRNCDLIFTPIFDKDPDIWALPDGGWTNIYEEYMSPNWSGKTYGYVSRGWCRVEMFYAANIPTKNSLERIEKFAAGLKHHAANGVRPHILYGTKDARVNNPFRVLPPLQNALFEQLHPAKGSLSVPSDASIIERLIDELRPYMKTVLVGYVGEKNENGQAHGVGTWTYPDGNRYEGQYQNDIRHGHGIQLYVNGNRYEGGWVDNKRHGQGTAFYADGDKYEGEWKEDKWHGYGIHSSVNGARYEGEWKLDKKHGYGMHLYANGNRYEGQYNNAKKHGIGKWLYSSSGNSFEGKLADGKLVQGQLLLPVLALKAFNAVFSGGDEIVVDGYEMYAVTLRVSEGEEIVKVCKFSNGNLIEGA